MQKKPVKIYHEIQIRLPWGIGLLLEEEARQLHESLGPYLAKAAYERFNIELFSGRGDRSTTELYLWMVKAGNAFIKGGPAKHPKYKTAQARVPLVDGAILEAEAKHRGESMGLYFMNAGFERYGRDLMNMRMDRLPSVVLATNQLELKARIERAKTYESKTGAKS